jgi:hypothetical protein
MDVRRLAYEYMNGDLATTFVVYLAFNKLVVDILGFSVLKLNTTQQLATFFFVSYTEKNQTGNLVQMEEPDIKHYQYVVDCPKHPKKEYDFLGSAIYGGRTLPRVRNWQSEDDNEDHYMQGDISGMYAHAQQNFPYPHGASIYRENCPILQEKVRKVWNKAKQLRNPELLALPEAGLSPFPHLFVAEVELVYPSLCSEPNVPFRYDAELGVTLPTDITGKGRLIHGIGQPDGNGGLQTRRQNLSNVHLANAMADGAELVWVGKVLYWSSHSKFLEPFMTEVNGKKIYYKGEGNNKGLETFYKLIANSFYGACLKREDTKTQLFLKFATKKEIKRVREQIKADNSYWHFHRNGTVTVKGEKIIDEDRFLSQRSTGLGIFVLAWSQYNLGHVTRTAFGDTFNPTTKDEARTAILRPLLYGDTDSLYFHRSHVQNLVASDKKWRALGRKDKLILWDKRHDEDKEKMGRFLDEQEDGTYEESFEDGRYVRVFRFASAAPKTYTHYARVPTDDPHGIEREIFKSKCKGVPLNKSVITACDISSERGGNAIMTFHNVPDNLRGPEWVNLTFRGKVTASIEEDEKESEAAKAWLKEEKARQHEEMRRVHQMMYTVIKSTDLMISTENIQSIKKYGIQPKSSYLQRTDGTFEEPESYAMGITNLNRCICSDQEELKWKGRRILTRAEASFLDLSEDIRRSRLVPIGYNYDNKLFELE